MNPLRLGDSHAKFYTRAHSKIANPKPPIA